MDVCMDFNAVYHRANDNYCYPLDEHRLIINLQTGYDVKDVYLVYGDPFSAGILGGGEVWSGERENILCRKRLRGRLWWTVVVEPPYKRLKYYFELQTAEEKWFYYEDGLLSEEQCRLAGRSRQYFIFPWMNPADVPVTPAWVRDTIWYQIYPDRFCNGDASRDPAGVLPWRERGSVRNDEFFGGDLAGITQKLDYLKELGISGIYLTPINEAPTTHKYDTTDYRRIDPQFGTAETMKTLVDEAHRRQIRIMLDGVFNHSGRRFAPWLDVREKGPASAYWDWFMVREWPFHENDGCARSGQYYAFAFVDGMPKLNTNNPRVREYLIDVCESWVREYDIDGLRLDVANELSHRFCKELRARLKALKPDFYILGEIWHDALPWLRGDEFDAVMNYPLRAGIKDFWIDKSLTGEDFEYMLNRCSTGCMQQMGDVMFNLLDSHDTKRLWSDVENPDVFFQQLAVLLSMPGSPCIYYGTEIGMEGGHDPDCRRCMPWRDIEAGMFVDCTETVRRLLKLRGDEPLMRSRELHFPDNGRKPRVLTFYKTGPENRYVEVIINCEEADVEIAQEGELLFSRLYVNRTLRRGGILIRKVTENPASPVH